jgi:hypothetical protein
LNETIKAIKWDATTVLLLLILLTQFPQMWGVYRNTLLLNTYIQEARSVHQTLAKELAEMDANESLHHVSLESRFKDLEAKLATVEVYEHEHAVQTERILRSRSTSQ